MSNASLELGGGKWGTKDGNLLGYASSTSSSKFVPREFTFTRSSDIAATRINSSGSIEKYRENLFLQSNQFDTTWLQTSCSVTSGQSGYDGSSDAWLLSKSDANGRVRQYMTSTGVRTASIYAKEGTTSWLRITYGGKTTYFDLGNGVLGNVNAIDSTITSVGNGFYRCTLTANAASADYVNIYPADSDGVTSGTSGSIYIQDAQLEKGLVATSYLESGATKATSGVADNEPRINYAGGTASLLLEPSRTNSWIHSEYLNYSFSQIVATTITQNTTETLSPEGLYNATKLEGIGSWIFKDFLAGTDTGTWTVSCWVKAVNPSSNNTFRLSVSGNNFSSNLTATNDWQRFSFSVTNGGATAAGLQRDTSANDADLYIYGLQVEAGSYPTSYIPTYGTSVTRNGDLAMTIPTDAFQWDGLAGGDSATLFIETKVTAVKSDNFNILSQGGSGVWKWSSSTFFARTNNPATAPSFNMGVDINTLEGSTIKIAFVKDNGNLKMFYNGSYIGVVSITTAELDWCSHISSNYQSAQSLKQFVGFNTALSDAECITLTT